MSTTGRDFILRIIEKYKCHECLWRIRHKDYHNKGKRNCALDDIVKLFRTKDPTANRESVQKKLQTMRGSYKKELRKVKHSQTARSDEDNVHVPKLWYFRHLSFLEDQETPKKGKTTSSLLDEDETSDWNEDVPCPVSSHSPLPTSTSKRTRQEADAILEKIAERLNAPSPSYVGKPHDAFGKYIAEKLRSIPTSMVPYCQKIINEAIFLAEIERLNVTSRITADQETVVSSSPFNPQISQSYSVVEDKYHVLQQDNTRD